MSKVQSQVPRSTTKHFSLGNLNVTQLPRYKRDGKYISLEHLLRQYCVCILLWPLYVLITLFCKHRSWFYIETIINNCNMYFDFQSRLFPNGLLSVIYYSISSNVSISVD